MSCPIPNIGNASSAINSAEQAAQRRLMKPTSSQRFQLAYSTNQLVLALGCLVFQQFF